LEPPLSPAPHPAAARLPPPARPAITRGMGELDDYADDDRRHDRDSPLLMPALVVAILVGTRLAGLEVVSLYARVFGAPG
jgi:hypothetical protein